MGVSLPKRPELELGLDFYLIAYFDLIHDRPIGMSGYGAIPWTAIFTWAQFHDIVDASEMALLVNFIRALEQADRKRIEALNPDNQAKRK
jgi:hypothetical protein